MNWAVGMLTASRPRPTIERSLASLKATGFDRVMVSDDVVSRGSWCNWFTTLETLTESGADSLLIVEDDAVFCKGLRGYLESTLWLDPGCALCSAYSCGRYTERDAMPFGWSEENRGHFLVGSLCWAIPRKSAEAILEDLRYSREGYKGIDLRVGLWALDTGRTVWYHKPSLVQHIGCANHAIKRIDQPEDPLWTASDFIGEDRTPAEAMRNL